MGSLPGPGMKVSVLSLGLLPLTFGYAIFRYRLMDVDLISSVAWFTRWPQPPWWGIISAGCWRCGTGPHAATSSGPVGLILAVLVTAFFLLFDPVRKWIQDRVDQFFYRTRYD